VTPYRLVIADDNAQIRLLLSMALPEYGPFEIVAEATNGAEAVTFTQQHRPDILLLDLSMPVMDGLIATEVIRGFDPVVRIAVFSGFQQISQAGRASHGINAYLEKGIALDELSQRLCALMAPGSSAVDMEAVEDSA